MPRVFPAARSFFAFHDGQQRRTDWFRIENKQNGPTSVHIYDEIGLGGITAGQFVQDVNGITGDLEVHLSTPGGEVFDGIAIYNALRARRPSVIVDSLAASIGSVIAMAAAPGQLYMQDTAKMMIHDGFAIAAGNAEDFTKLVDQLNSASDTIASIYASRTGSSAAEWRTAMKAETWYNAQQAVDAGLADVILGVGNRDSVTLRNAATVPYVGSGQARHVPMTGTHSHDHAAMGASDHDDGMHAHVHTHNGDASHSHTHDHEGWLIRDGKWVFDPENDGDDDSSAATDTDHDWWTADGKLRPGKVIPPKPTESPTGHPDMYGEAGDILAGVLMERLLDASVDNSPWDASKAWAAGAKSDDPAKFYAGICAGKKSGDKSTQAAWALPYRYSPSSAPNAAAVRNALARIDQTQGLTNKAEAQSLLEGLMKKINPDYKPDDSIDPAALRALFVSGLEGGQ